jgi:hypothetical protein
VRDEAFESFQKITTFYFHCSRSGIRDALELVVGTVGFDRMKHIHATVVQYNIPSSHFEWLDQAVALGASMLLRELGLLPCRVNLGTQLDLNIRYRIPRVL